MTFSITQSKIHSPFNHLYKTLPVWLSPASNSLLVSHCFSNPISYYHLIIRSPPAILPLFCSSNIPDLPRPQGLCTLCSLFLVCSFCQYLWVLRPHFFFFLLFFSKSPSPWSLPNYFMYNCKSLASLVLSIPFPYFISLIFCCSSLECKPLWS